MYIDLYGSARDLYSRPEPLANYLDVQQAEKFNT